MGKKMLKQICTFINKQPEGDYSPITPCISHNGKHAAVFVYGETIGELCRLATDN